MKTPERFNNAISKLVKAFFDGSIRKGHCCSCAMGVICNENKKWNRVFYTDSTLNHRQYQYPAEYKDESKKVIDETGYSWQELAKVEYSFEVNAKIDSYDYFLHGKGKVMKDIQTGLMAVVEKLCEIENIDTAEYKKYFEYDENFKPVNPL